MSRVLITGGSGFIGRRALGRLLDRGFEVHAVARKAPDGTPAAVHWHEADLLDAAESSAVVGRVEAAHLLHLAWYAEPGRYWTALENVRWAAATAALLESFAAHGGTRAVLAGTCAEYRWGDAEGPCVEGVTPLEPATLYGICKDAARRLAEGLASELDLSLAWGRIFFVYGPGEHPDRLVSSVARAMVAGERAATSEGTQRRDFMHVDDVAGAFVALLASGVRGAVNVGSGDAVAVRDVVRRLAAAAGGERLLDVGALPQRAGEPPVLVADTRRLRQEVRFVPRFSLDAGLVDTVRWWRDRCGNAVD